MMLLNLCFDRHQWTCLLSMTLGMILVQGGTASTTGTPIKGQNTVHGAAAMVIAAGCVAFSGVFMEMMLKTSPHHLTHNANLAAYSSIFALAGYFWRSGLQVEKFFQGYHALVWLFVLMNAGGGFLVAWCIRITSTVGKNYAQGLGFVLASTIPLLVQSRQSNRQVRFTLVINWTLYGWPVQAIDGVGLGYNGSGGITVWKAEERATSNAGEDDSSRVGYGVWLSQRLKQIDFYFII
jgi:hypothetical protein